MTYNVWTNSKPDLVAATAERARAFEIAAAHADGSGVVVTEKETGRSWVISRVENLDILPRLALPTDPREPARD